MCSLREENKEKIEILYVWKYFGVVVFKVELLLELFGKIYNNIILRLFREILIWVVLVRLNFLLKIKILG